MEEHGKAHVRTGLEEFDVAGVGHLHARLVLAEALAARVLVLLHLVALRLGTEHHDARVDGAKGNQAIPMGLRLAEHIVRANGVVPRLGVHQGQHNGLGDLVKVHPLQQGLRGELLLRAPLLADVGVDVEILAGRKGFRAGRARIGGGTEQGGGGDVAVELAAGNGRIGIQQWAAPVAVIRVGGLSDCDCEMRVLVGDGGN